MKERISPSPPAENGLDAAPLYILEHQIRRGGKGGSSSLRLVQIVPGILSLLLGFSAAPPSGPGSSAPQYPAASSSTLVIQD